jgi:glycosyltransferase involved in cell wall biosynthesis
MGGAVDVVETGHRLDGRSLLEELRRPRDAQYMLIHAPGVRVGGAALSAMLDAARAPMAATVSPLPVAVAGSSGVAVVAGHPRLPSPPTLAIGCPTACLISREALASVGLLAPMDGADPHSVFIAVSERLTQGGWRHVAAPNVALAWPTSLLAGSPPSGVWTRDLIAHQSGPANEALATHVLWATTRLRPIRLLIDGACLTDSIHNGSQIVVVNVARAMKRARPTADVVLAVHKAFVRTVSNLVAGEGVEVVERKRDIGDFDVVYRPYQLLDPGELDWLSNAAARLVVSQLDMIAFSNPTYHPSAALYHAVRNLQRHTMRLADGVTFISDFGMRTAIAECPDIEDSRCFVVGCGADAEPLTSGEPSDSLAARMPDRFIACVSATFWHKNRQHAVAVFETLCNQHGYEGSLLIAGPEPYYGSSAGEDAARVPSLSPGVRDRVVMLGQISEQDKWCLLERAELVLYPSLIEGFGLVPFEAAAVGTPSLAPAASAIGEALAGCKGLVRSWEVDEWARAAASILSSPGAAVEVVDDIRGASADLTWDAVAVRTWAATDATLAQPHAYRHSEEGGVASVVAGGMPTLARGARLAHFANRLKGYIERRVDRGLPGR